jgi:hypothetical protein
MNALVASETVASNPPSVPQTYLAAILQNVAARTPYCQYFDLYYEGREDKITLGVSSRSLMAARLISSAADGFEREFSEQLRSRSPRIRAEAAPLREARSILRRAARNLDRELSAQLEERFGKSRHA